MGCTTIIRKSEFLTFGLFMITIVLVWFLVDPSAMKLVLLINKIIADRSQVQNIGSIKVQNLVFVVALCCTAVPFHVIKEVIIYKRCISSSGDYLYLQRKSKYHLIVARVVYFSVVMVLGIVFFIEIVHKNSAIDDDLVRYLIAGVFSFVLVGSVAELLRIVWFLNFMNSQGENNEPIR